MLKRTWSLLLVITFVAAPGAAFAAAPDRAAADRDPSLLERVWGGIRQLLDIDGERADEPTREPQLPRSISAGDEGSGHVDPDG